MKPTTFVITLILALLIGWGLLKCNRQPETVAGATSSTVAAPVIIATTPVAPAVAPAAAPAPAPAVAATSVSEVRAQPSASYYPTKERFEPNTASAPDHRPLF